MATTLRPPPDPGILKTAAHTMIARCVGIDILPRVEARDGDPQRLA
jgi:hypothetical protein